MKQRHPHAPPGPTGHSVLCPCHQLGWVQMRGTRPPVEKVQRRVVGDHRRVNRAAQGTVFLSAPASAPRTKRQVLGACTCALCVRVGARSCAAGCQSLPGGRVATLCHDAEFCHVARGPAVCHTQHVPLHTMHRARAVHVCVRVRESSHVLRGATISALRARATLCPDADYCSVARDPALCGPLAL